MSGVSIAGLGWLPQPPQDFRARLRAAAPAGQGADTGALRWLVSHALDLNRLMQVARALDRCTGEGLSRLRLALLIEGTTDYIAPAIRASALRHGVLADLWVPAYGGAMQAVLGGDAGLREFGPQAALIAADHRSLGLDRPRTDAGQAAQAVAAALDRLTALAQGVAALDATPILQTVPVPPDPWCGHLDARLPGSVAGQVAALNAGLLALAERTGALVLDAADLAGLVGRSAWFDPGQWQAAKLSFALDLVPLHADHAARLLAALRGRMRKCLVLDLDNTLWGGVIGDDGLEGIRLGSGSAVGEAHLAVQRVALDLRARGIVLAVCSKNEDATARLPFRDHPEMLLREEHIAVFLADWTDKASNLATIAGRLEIGTDALVFLDDNPAERARVRQMLPEVAVPELPDDPAWYPAALLQGGWFETPALTADDTARAAQYSANAERAATRAHLGDYAAYLASLDMECMISPFDAAGRARIAQLMNKSNQFNLTTRRTTEAQVAAVEADPTRFTLQIRLADRFGDNGMISVLVVSRGPRDWLCEDWLMSCRVLGRRVEEAALAAAALAAKAEGAKRLLGLHVATGRNALVAGHYPRLGFVPLPAAEAQALAASLQGLPEGKAEGWALDLSRYEAPALPMRLTGAAAPALPVG